MINLTALLLSNQGHQNCVVATWNDKAALDEGRFVSLYSGILEVLANLQ